MHLLHLTDFHYGDPATAPLDPAALRLAKACRSQIVWNAAKKAWRVSLWMH